MLRNLMLVANASSAVVGFAVLGLAAALHFGERPEGHLDIGLVHADDALFALGGAVVGVSLLGLLGSREVRAQGRCAAGLLSAYAICLLLLLLALGGLGVHAYTAGMGGLGAELDSHWGAVQAVVQVHAPAIRYLIITPRVGQRQTFTLYAHVYHPARRRTLASPPPRTHS